MTIRDGDRNLRFPVCQIEGLTQRIDTAVVYPVGIANEDDATYRGSKARWRGCRS